MVKVDRVHLEYKGKSRIQSLTHLKIAKDGVHIDTTPNLGDSAPLFWSTDPALTDTHTPISRKRIAP
jgi:hypothetical protein